MDATFNNELAALERAINRLEEAVVRRKRTADNNFERIVLNDLRARCERLTDEKIHFMTIVNEARQGRFYTPPTGGESPTP